MPDAYEVCRELLAREILVDYRPKAGVRVSPHFYNREEECDFHTRTNRRDSENGRLGKTRSGGNTCLKVKNFPRRFQT